MPPLLQLRDTGLTLGGAPLLDGAELSISAGDRIAVVGRNGSGKSTLFRIAAGQITADRGSRFVQPSARLAYLPQEPDMSGFATTLDYVLAGLNEFDDAYAARAMMAELGVDLEWVQDNHSRSRQGTVRGMHFQPGMAKLVRCARGAILDVLGDLYGPAVGGKRTYQNLTIGYSYYHSLGTKNVFAIRGSACMVTSAAPFYDLCLLGMSKDLRGYQVGQFRDNRMVVGQAEYRRDLFWRVGAVAFAGAGGVAPTWAGFGSAEPKPGGGVGLRFVLAKRNHINLRADFAWGENSRATYISVGEAF